MQKIFFKCKNVFTSTITRRPPQTACSKISMLGVCDVMAMCGAQAAVKTPELFPGQKSPKLGFSKSS